MDSVIASGVNAILSVLIVDDEPLAHQVFNPSSEDHPGCQLLGQCYSAVQALQWLANNSVDVVFLDINMPHLSGMNMLKVLANRTQVVIVGLTKDYALAGFGGGVRLPTQAGC